MSLLSLDGYWQVDLPLRSGSLGIPEKDPYTLLNHSACVPSFDFVFVLFWMRYPVFVLEFLHI
jgi:hypothetical protein